MNRLKIYKQALADYKATRKNYESSTMERLSTQNGLCFYLLERYNISVYQPENRRRLVPELAEVISDYEKTTPDGIISRGFVGIEWIDLRITMLEKAISLCKRRPSNLLARFIDWIKS